MKLAVVLLSKMMVFLVLGSFSLIAQELSVVKYVELLENPKGGYWPAESSKGKNSSLRATVSALRIYKYSGKILPNFQKHREFMISCWNSKEQGFADFPGGMVNVVNTSVGLMGARDGGFLDEAKRAGGKKYLLDHSKSFEDIRIAAAFLGEEAYDEKIALPWLKIIQTNKNNDGTFGQGFSKPRDSASVWVTMLRLQSPHKHNANLVKDFRMKDGGFGSSGAEQSDLETAYRVCRYFYMVKDANTLKDTLKFIESCRNTDGGYSPRPGEKSAIGATYHAVIINKWAN